MRHCLAIGHERLKLRVESVLMLGGTDFSRAPIGFSTTQDSGVEIGLAGCGVQGFPNEDGSVHLVSPEMIVRQEPEIICKPEFQLKRGVTCLSRPDNPC